MALWEFSCVKCGAGKDVLTSELDQEGQRVKVGEETDKAGKCEKCGCARLTRKPTMAAHTPDKWR